MENGAGLAATVGGFFLEAALVAALFKVQGIPEAIPADSGIKELGSVLGSAEAQAVEAQGILVVLAVFAVLAAAYISQNTSSQL